MKMGAYTACLHDEPVEEAVGLLAELGLDSAEIDSGGFQVRARHAQDVTDAIELAALLGVRRVVTTSGLPATDAAGRLPAWTVQPWDSAYLDARDSQWNDVAAGRRGVAP